VIGVAFLAAKYKDSSIETFDASPGHQIRSVIGTFQASGGGSSAKIIDVAAESTQSLVGTAHIVDGDTLRVGGTTVRLKGVDAAERGTDIGDIARDVMREMAEGRQVTCQLTGEHTWGREVGYCSLVGGRDLNEAIVSGGFALACARYSDRYVSVEQARLRDLQSRAAYCRGG